MKRLYILAFIFTLHIALSGYVNSTYLSEFINENYVGLLYTAGSLVTLIAFSYSSEILAKIGDRKAIILGVLINFITLLVLGFAKTPILIIGAFIAFMVTNSIIMLLLDVFFEHLEDGKTIGNMRGIYLSVTNLAWLVSPVLSGYIISVYGHASIYIVASVLALLMLSRFFIARFPASRKYLKISFFKAIKHLNGNKNIRAIVGVNFLLQFFYAIMVIYTPIYLIDHIGFDWETLGIIFTIMLLPFILLGIPVGKIIDKGVSEKKLITVGFIVMALATFCLLLIQTKTIILWAIILFTTRFGAALVETASEIYFFKRSEVTDTDILSIFRDMSPFAYIVAPITATLLLLIFPFKVLFILITILMFFGALLSRVWLTK